MYKVGSLVILSSVFLLLLISANPVQSSHFTNSTCPSPYHIITSDDRCVWSCGTGTTPDSVSNECICQSGYTQTGTDTFGRRTCSVSSFDFSTSTNPYSGTVTAGGSVTTTVSLTLLSGTTESVTLSCSSLLPSGVSCSFSQPSCNPTCSSTATISTSSTTPTGTHTITISGVGGGKSRGISYDLTVNAPPTGPACVNGPIPGNGACVCNGVTYSTGYCCNNIYSSSTPCTTNALQCAEGAVPSSGCLCSGYAYTSGYCCKTALQSGLVWAGNTPCTQTCPTIAKSVSSSYSGVCCGGSLSDCKGTWSNQWATDCQGYVCCIGTAQPLCTGSAYGDGAPSPTPTPTPTYTYSPSPTPNQTNYTYPSPSITTTPTPTTSPSPTTILIPTPIITPTYSPTYSPSPTPQVSCNTDLECAWRITNSCPENAGASWGCIPHSQQIQDIPSVCPQTPSKRPSFGCGCIQNNCVPFPEAKKPTEPPRKIGHTDFDTTKLLSVIIQMEQLKVKFDFLKSATAKLALYYNATGNSDSFNKWLTATQMLENGIDKIENLKTEVRNKIDTFGVDDLRELKKEIKSVIGIIKDIVKTILAPPTTPIDASRLPPNQTQPTTPTPSLNQTQFVNQTNLTTPRPLSLSSKLIFVKKAVVQDQDIYLYDITTRKLAQLTSRYEYGPTWSPKGSYISYVSNNPNKTGVYIVNSDGTNSRRIGGGAFSWLPDESKIVYSQREGTAYFIYSADLVAVGQGSNATKEKIAEGLGSSVSPDGSRVIHITNDRLYVTKLDTKAELLLANGGIARYYWSPDSTKVAYMVYADSGLYTLNIIKADGTNKVSINIGSHNAGPSLVWSPDSTKLAYLKVNNSKTYVYVVNADGNRETQIGETMRISSSTQFPPMSWSPEGSKIAYSKLSSSDNKLYLTIVNPDGTQETQLSSADSGKDPAWSPDGSKIAYTKTIGSKNYVFIINRDGTEDIRIAEGSEPQWQPTGGQ